MTADDLVMQGVRSLGPKVLAWFAFDKPHHQQGCVSCTLLVLLHKICFQKWKRYLTFKVLDPWRKWQSCAFILSIRIMTYQFDTIHVRVLIAELEQIHRIQIHHVCWWPGRKRRKEPGHQQTCWWDNLSGIFENGNGRTNVVIRYVCLETPLASVYGLFAIFSTRHQIL